jgi:hypothetical protein
MQKLTMLWVSSITIRKNLHFDQAAKLGMSIDPKLLEKLKAYR